MLVRTDGATGGRKSWAQEVRRTRLPQLRDLAESDRRQSDAAELLTCVYQATRNSGETTRQRRRDGRQGAGAEFLQWNVDADGRRLCHQLSRSAIGRELTWKTRRRRAAERPGPRRGAGRVAAGELRNSALLAGDEQPQRGGRRLRDDGRRHVRRARADRRHRQGVSARLAQVDGNDRAARRRTDCRH